MANQPMNSVTKRIVNVYRDEGGEILAELGTESRMTTDAHGNVVTEQVNDNVQLGCGHMFNPAQAMGKDASVALAVCSECRVPLSFSERANHGLYVDDGTRCADCHACLCPKHARRCSDGQYRCARHAGNHRILHGVGTVLRQLLFKDE